MTRYILCQSCADKFTLHPEDRGNGFSMRKVSLFVKKPEIHQIKERTVVGGNVTKEVITDLPSLLCDHCNERLADGTGAVAVTMWRGGPGHEPDGWERDYQQKQPEQKEPSDRENT